jgi:type IX secretion system PorP/SprF family membrane protein
MINSIFSGLHFFHLFPSKKSFRFQVLPGLFLFFFASKLAAQDPQFSQFYSNPLYLNPAFAGTSIQTRFVSNYRNQWPNSGNTYVTYNLSYDKYVKSVNGGIGFNLFYDRELNGVVNTINSSFFYAYHVKANDRLFFTGALQAGFIFKQFNTSDLIFPGMIDQENGNITGIYPLPIEDGQKIFPDISFGMAGQQDNVYFGLALHHLTQPNQSIIEGDQVGNLPMKMTVHIGAKSHKFHHLLISKEFTLSPNVIFEKQGSYQQLNLGLYMNEDWLTFGLWYRNNLSVRPDAVIAMIGYTTPKFQLGYSFDYSLSELSAYSYGSHEISLIFFVGENNHKGLGNTTMRIPTL